MLQFTVKGAQINVDDNLLTAETKEKGMYRGLKRMLDEKFGAKEFTGDKIAEITTGITDWNKFFARAERVAGMSTLDKELTLMVKQFIQDKKLIPDTIAGKTFAEKYEIFADTPEYQAIFDKAKANQKWIDKAQKNIDKKAKEALARKRAKEELASMEL